MQMVALLSALLLVLIAKTQICSSQDVIRGERDRFCSDINLSNDEHVTCDDTNFCECGVDGEHNTFIFNSKAQTGECVQDDEIIKDKQGCYHFLGGNKVLALVKNGNVYNIRAPEIYWWNHDCGFNWSKSKLSTDGYTWRSVTIAAGEFSLSRTRKWSRKKLKIANMTSLLTKWPGRLLRLNISCYVDFIGGRYVFENHCLLLKISGSAYIKPRMVSTTSTTSSTASLETSFITISTSSPTSSATSLPTSSPMSSSPSLGIHDILEAVKTSTSQTTTSAGVPSPNITSSIPTSSLPPNHYQANSNNRREKSDDNSSNVIPIVASAVGFFCLLLIVAGIVLLYRWRKRSTPKQDDINLYEDADSRSVSTLGSQQTSENHKSSDVYDLPGTQINSAAEYDYISPGTVEPDTCKIDDNKYDYATCEEAGDTTSSLTSPKSYSNDIYQAIDENVSPNENHNQNNPSCPGNDAVYHTLEDNGGETWDGDQIYEELDDIQQREPVYNVLEGPE